MIDSKKSRMRTLKQPFVLIFLHRENRFLYVLINNICLLSITEHKNKNYFCIVSPTKVDAVLEKLLARNIWQIHYHRSSIGHLKSYSSLIRNFGPVHYRTRSIHQNHTKILFWSDYISEYNSAGLSTT